MSTVSLPLPVAVPSGHVYPPAALCQDATTLKARMDESAIADDDEDSTEIHKLRAIPSHLSQATGRLSAISRVNVTNARVSSVSLSKTDGASIREDLVAVPSLPNTTASDAQGLNAPSASELRKFRNIGNIHLAALGFALFVEGWNDGSTGPLLPVFQSTYHIGFFIVSLYFVSNCAGFIIGSALNVYLNDKIGFGKIMILGACAQLAAYVIQAPQPPFPVMVAANALTGFGMALQNAQANGLVGSLKQHMSTKLGIMHGLYGLGAFTSPFVATHFSAQKHWSFHYLISTGLAVTNVTILTLIFRMKTAETLLAESGQAPDENIATSAPSESKFYQIAKLKAVHLLAIFALIYIGIEVTIGGWIVTYVIEHRGGGHSAGYISSGFFGGLTLGRVGLMWLNKRLGPRHAIFLYTIVTIGLELTIWFVPSVIGNAVAVSLAGMALGPMFPLLVTHATTLLPRWLFTVALGWITGVGMTGSAALPFLTGVLSQKFGIQALQPWLVSMMGCLLVVWSLVPKPVRRID